LAYPTTPNLNKTSNSADGAHFALGKHNVVVSGASRDIWNLLVDDICARIQQINRITMDYSESLQNFFEKARYLSLVSDRMRVSEREMLHYAYRRAQTFNELLGRFQSLSARSTLSRARQVFADLSSEAIQLVNDMEEIASNISHKDY